MPCSRRSGCMLVVAAPQALAANGPKDNEARRSSFSRSTTSTVTSQPNTPGSIQVGCCNAGQEHDGVQTGWTQKTVPAGGIEYLATHMKQLREQNSNTITVGAGDLIGASPLVSALFHDEPTIEAMNALGLDVTGVGNHEFDEGVNELLRMQFGGCHPVDGCQDGDGFAGAVFKYLAANVFYAGTDETILPPYEIEKIDNAKIAFIGLTLEGTPTIVTPIGRRRPRVPARGRDGQRARREAPERAGRQGVRRAPPPGRLAEPACAGVPGAREPAGRLHGRQPLRQLQRRRDHRRSRTASIRGSRSWSARTRISRTSARSTASSSRARPRSAA